MTINLGSGGQITYQQWKTLTPLEQSQVAATLGFDPQYVDTQLSAGEQVQGSTGKPGTGGETPSSTLPNLTTPNWGLISPESFSLVQEFLGALGFTLEQAEGALSGAGTLEDELKLIQQAIEEFTSEEGGAPQAPPETVGSGEGPTPPTPEPTPEVVTGLSQLWDKISAQIQAGTAPIPENYADIAAKMSSQNPDDVKAAIFQLVDLSNLTDAQKTFITGKLEELSSSIATSIAAGGSASFFIRLGIPELLTVQFAAAVGLTPDTTMSADDQTLLLNVLTQLATGLSDVNFTVATGTQTPSPEYTQLTSQDPEQLKSFLTSIFASVELPPGTMTEDEKSALIAALAAEFTSGETLPTELTSSNQGVVSDYLTKLIAKLASDGKLTSSEAASMAQSLYLIPALSAQLASINQAQCITNLYSTDETVISSSLHNLGSIPTPPSNEVLKNLPPDQVLQQFGQSLVMESYLKVLVKALAFMAQIRTIINQLEGKFSQELANAKLANIAAQVQTALAKYQKEMDEIQSDYKATIKAMHKQKLMRWLMPLITILVTVVMTIVSVVATVFSAGTLTVAALGLAVLVAKVIVLAVVITLTVVMAVLTIVDAARSMQGKKGIWATAAEAIAKAMTKHMEKTPEWLKSLLSCVLQVAAAVLVAVFTFGAGIGASAAMVAGGVSKMAGLGMKQLVLELTNALEIVSIQLVMMMVITPLMSSGLLTQIILELLKACGSHDDKLNAILAMIITILTMIVIMIIGGKIQSSIQQAALGASKGAAEAMAPVSKSFSDKIKELFLGIKNAATTATGSIGGMIASPGKTIEQLFKSILAALQTITKQAPTMLDKVLQQMREILASLPNALAQYIKGLPASVASGVKGYFAVGTRSLEGIPGILESFSAPVVRVLNLLTQLLQLAMQIYNGVTDFQMAKIYEGLADLKKKVAELEASAELMQMLSSDALDSTQLLKDLSEDAKTRADDWAELVRMVASYITNASQNFSQLIAKGSRTV